MYQRIDRLRKRIEHFELDAFLITSLANIRYLYGFTGSNGIGLITSDLSFFVTDRRYIQQAKQQVHNAEILIGKQDLLAELKKENLLNSGTKLGFEARHLTVKEFTHLKKTFPEVKLIASERIVEKIASVKDSEEIANLKKAAVICGEIFDEIISLLKPGMRELDISAELSYRTKLHGSEKDPFEPMVVSGTRSALPHGASSVKRLQLGDLVILDFGAVVNGYAADFTRTIVMGEPSHKQKEMTEVVIEALHMSEAATKPGIIGKNLDGVARDYLKQHGYAQFFMHSLGHGLGLEVHGLPRIGELSNDPLEVGNVIALEPGVYLPEIGGVRIEDNFVMTKEGIENLNPVRRELISVG
ncbi:MAG: M24 family metallopeptidase [bacterium]